MNQDTSGLSIKGESIQSLYGSYLSGIFLVNRRYQRKLVWTVEEKRSFLDSIIKGYPVPLILLAEVITEKGIRKLEIIDGMQRLNAIMSFINQEFDIDKKFFDLDSMADTKLLKDNKKIIQKPSDLGDLGGFGKLDREVCAYIARYQIPLSVFQGSGTSHIDEIFRRLNSGGRHLSKQELRQAGATSNFASIVRKLASNIRGDSSASDILDLSFMKNISITNLSLDYGISIENIFWVKNNIITKEDLRQSKDEEIIADIVAWVVIGKGIRSSSEILNQLYGHTEIAAEVEIQIQKVNEDLLKENIQFVFDELIQIITQSGKTFNSLLFERQQAKISRYFQIVFLSLYKFLIEEELEIINKRGLIEHFDKAGSKIIKLGSGGGNWSLKEKQTKIDAFGGVIKSCFDKRTNHDPARHQWITRFENILMQSSTEQALYDFKVGLHHLTVDGGEFSQKTFSKVIKTLTAMANTFPNSTGYCLLGVADEKATAEKHKEIYGFDPRPYSTFFITGINAEAEKYHGNIDKYFTKVTQMVAQEPLSDRDKDNISRNISNINYFDKTVIILKIESGDIPSIYDRKYYVRRGSNIDEVKPENFSELYSRFHRKLKQ